MVVGDGCGPGVRSEGILELCDSMVGNVSYC